MSPISLIEAVKAGDVESVRSGLHEGQEVNQQDEKGWTPLCWASGRGSVEIIELLLANSADVFLVGEDQRTPYKIALAAGRIEAARRLREVEDERNGTSGQRAIPKYCKGYELGRLRQFPGWTEFGGAEPRGTTASSSLGSLASGSSSTPAKDLEDDDIVFLHQNYTVTKSIWQDRDIIFERPTQEWKAFCHDVLSFHVPDELELAARSSEA